MKKIFRILENTPKGVKVLSTCATYKGANRMLTVFRNRRIDCGLDCPVVWDNDEGSGWGMLNCTPHPITLRKGDRVMIIEPSGIIPRVTTNQLPMGSWAGFPINKNVYGKIEGLPAPMPAISLIVSAMVLSAAVGRIDLIAPDTGKDAIRDSDGKIIAVTGFVC